MKITHICVICKFQISIKFYFDDLTLNFIPSGVRGHVFLWAQKLLVDFFGNFYMTFSATWGCASDFLVMLPKFKMAARACRGQLQIFL